MSTVIGLFPCNQEVSHQIRRLEEDGFARESIRVLTQVGALIGGIIGGITGMAEYEKDTHLYTQGVQMGNRVLVLLTELGYVERAKTSLLQVGCISVRMIPEQDAHV